MDELTPAAQQHLEQEIYSAARRVDSWEKHVRGRGTRAIADKRASLCEKPRLTIKTHIFKTLEGLTRRLAVQKVPYVNEDLIANLILIPGSPVDGVELETELLVRLTRQAVGDRRFYIVRDWMLFDVMLSDSHLSQLERDGGCATILYASDIAYDSNTGGALPGAFRTGYQRSFSAFHFETNSAVFVLAGPGSRKYASVPAILALDAA